MITARWCLLVLVSCAHGPSTPTPIRAAGAPPEERWETVSDRRFVYTQTCATGPFEVAFPAREIEYARRIVLQVWGARGVQLDNRIDSSRFQTGLGVATIEEGDHSRCRADDSGEPVVIAGTPGTPGGPGSGNSPPTEVLRRGPPKSGYDTPSSELPQLVEHSGKLPSFRQQASAIAWLPRGDPWFYDDEYSTDRIDDDTGVAEIRIRFWFERPSNLDGLVFQFVEERLVPTQLDGYAERFAARVAEANARRAARRHEVAAAWEHQNQMCELFPDDNVCVERRRERGRIPPAPRAETPPKPPSANVDWIPGYWSWTPDVEDFVWIDGTYVVRAADVAVAAPVNVPPLAPEAEPDPPVTVASTIDPPPRVPTEVIVAPPAQPGAMWIAGHWRLVGTAWQWIAGSWSQPPAGGARYRGPSLRVNGNVRVYLPERWIRLR